MTVREITNLIKKLVNEKYWKYIKRFAR
jgi:hypothetical protein